MPRSRISELLELPIVSWPLWKHLLAALFVSGMLTFMSWGFREVIVGNVDYPKPLPLSVRDVITGSMLSLISFWMRWAWKPRRKHAYWHRWLSSLIYAIYVNFLLLLLGTACWNALLKSPDDWIVNSVLVLLVIIFWILPVLSSHWAKRLAVAHYTLDLRMLPYAKVLITAGILGASFGMNAARSSEVWIAILLMGFLSSLAAISVPQRNAEKFWGTRPWAKGEYV